MQSTLQFQSIPFSEEMDELRIYIQGVAYRQQLLEISWDHHKANKNKSITTLTHCKKPPFCSDLWYASSIQKMEKLQNDIEKEYQTSLESQMNFLQTLSSCHGKNYLIREFVFFMKRSPITTWVIEDPLTKEGIIDARLSQIFEEWSEWKKFGKRNAIKFVEKFGMGSVTYQLTSFDTPVLSYMLQNK